MTRVRFIERYCGYFPGAEPTIDDALAARLIEEGKCKPYDDPAEVTTEEPSKPKRTPKAKP